MTFHSPNTFLNTVIVLIAAIFGGQVEIPTLNSVISQISTTPDLTELYSFSIKCGQSVVFAAIGYGVKLSLDQIFTKKKPGNE